MKKALIALLLLLIPGTALATAQMPDHLYFQGKFLSIYTNPLESYFRQKQWRPNKLFPGLCSALWRGYQATWKITGNVLYLVHLRDGNCGGPAKDIALSKIFPGQKGPIKASWYSGTLRVPQGKKLKYVHMGYRSVYEKDLLIDIEMGRVMDVRTVINKDPVH